MNRRNQLLAALLALQLLLVAVVYWPRPSQAGAAPLFPNLNAADVLSLSISDGNEVLNLSNRAGQWLLPDAGDFPAQNERVEALLGKIAALQTGRLVAQTPASHARLQVAATEFVRRVQFETAAGERHTVWLGSAASGSSAHFRVDDAAEVYIAADLSSFDANAQPAGYIDTGYISLAAADITAMTVRNASGELLFRKDAEGTWTLAGLDAGQETDSSKVASLVSRLAGLYMTQPLGVQPLPAWGFDAPAATITLTVTPAEGAPQTHELQVGAKDADSSSYAVKYSGSPYYVRAAAFNLDDLVQNSAAAFLLAPPAEATPSP